MQTLSRRHLIRLGLAWMVLLTALACGGTTCDCVNPLEAPIAEDAKLYDSVQARLTNDAFDFIEDNLTTIISMFMADGLTFDVPRMDNSMEFGWCPVCITINLRICENGCTLSAEIVDAAMTPVAPDTLTIDMVVNLTGTITLNGTFDCDIPVTVQNKPVQANVQLTINPDDHLMSFRISGVSFSLSDSDYHITCDWGFLSDIGLGGVIDDVVNWILGLLTGTINNLIADQLDSALDGALDSAVCLACDYYTGGCPSGSSCSSDFCQSGGNCLTNPLGMAGTLDLGELLADFSPGMQAELDIFLAAGQAQSATADPLVVNNGVEIRMIGGVDTTRHACVPIPDPAEIPSNAPPARLVFGNTIPDTADPYMAGIGLSDAFLDWFMYKVHLTGLLCLSIGTETTDMLTSGTISLMGLGSLNDLTTGRNVPVQLKLRPGHVPYMEVGAGTYTEDPDGNPVIDEPLIYIFLPGVGLDFYVLLDEHWTRILTITLDIEMDVGLTLDADNKLVPLFGEDSIHMDNVVASNYELLAEDPATLENLIPTLVGMALPMLTGAIAPIEIPPIEGFVLDIAAMKGVKPRAGTPYYEYLGLYANLSFAPPPPEKRNTWADLDEVEMPRLELMSIRNPEGPVYPQVRVRVRADGDQPAEYTYRVDDGFWHLFAKGPILRITDPRLLLAGEHVVEVRARSLDDYRSLDPTPARVVFDILPEGLDKNLLVPSERDRIEAGRFQAASGDTTESEPDNLDIPEQGAGCACASAHNGSGIWLLLAALGLVIGRRRRG